MLKKKKCNGVWFFDTGLQIWGLYVNMAVGIKIVHRVGFLWLICGLTTGWTIYGSGLCGNSVRKRLRKHGFPREKASR